VPKMNKNTLRVVRVLVSAALVFVVLFLGSMWLENQTVTRPLEAMLMAQEGVLDAEVTEESGLIIVEITLDAVWDLKSVHESIEQSIKQMVGTRRFDIKLRDSAGSDLEEAFYLIHLDLYQAVATGEFRDAFQAVEQRLDELDVERFRLSVDSDVVYVQLHSGQHYLYRVISRMARGQG